RRRPSPPGVVRAPWHPPAEPGWLAPLRRPHRRPLHRGVRVHLLRFAVHHGRARRPVPLCGTLRGGPRRALPPPRRALLWHEARRTRLRLHGTGSRLRRRAPSAELVGAGRRRLGARRRRPVGRDHARDQGGPPATGSAQDALLPARRLRRRPPGAGGPPGAARAAGPHSPGRRRSPRPRAPRRPPPPPSALAPPHPL